MTRFSLGVTEFWRRPFVGEPIFRDARLSLTVNPDLDHSERVTVLHTADDAHTAIAVAPLIAEALDDRGIRADSSGIDETRVRDALVDVGIVLHGADNIYYFPDGHDTEGESEQAPVVRQLTAADRELFAAFEAEASEQDRDNAQVDLDDWAAFGVISDGRLVSVASTYPWNDSSLADFGVLTLERARGRGHGRRLVRAAARHAQELGCELQYRCQLDNAASNALAGAAGLQLFGTWEVPTPEEQDAEATSAG